MGSLALANLFKKPIIIRLTKQTVKVFWDVRKIRINFACAVEIEGNIQLLPRFPPKSSEIYTIFIRYTNTFTVCLVLHVVNILFHGIISILHLNFNTRM